MQVCCSGLGRPLLLVLLAAVSCTYALEALPLCDIGDSCEDCDLQFQQGDRCKKEGERYQVLYCNNNTGFVYPEEDAYYECIWPRQKLRKQYCDRQSYFSARHAECLDVTVRKYRQAYTTGSSRLGDACVQNTDCIDYLMYCSSGICACTSSAVQINDVCYKKIEPSQTSCSYDQQCTSYWPNTVCTSGTCTCPTSFIVADSRDGNVCVRAGTTPNFYCPLPDNFAGTGLYTTAYSLPSTTYLSSITPLFGQVTSGTIDTCTVQTGCVLTISSTINAVAVTVPTTDQYDCIRSTAASTTTGICCPSRAYTCAQPRATGTPTNAGQAGTQRYYYNTVAGTCEEFTFYTTGTGVVLDVSTVNGNNFATRDHCITYCQNTCERGSPQYTTGNTDPTQLSPLACTATSSTCDSNHQCDRIGSNYYCCGKPEYMCGLLGGRSVYTTAPSTADTGFWPHVATGVTATTTSRYFFNPNTGTCEVFQYSFGGGNYNNYASTNDCENYCYQELCTYGNPLKTTTGTNQRCSSDSDCPTFYQCTSGTGATSIQICCPRTQTICEQAKIIGTCTTWVRRYWHNPRTGECEQFQYSGCGGNDNNFKLQIDCQTACRDTTAQPQCIQGLAYKDSFSKYYACSSSGTGGTQCPANYQCYFDGFMWGCCPLKPYTCSLSSDAGRECGAAVSRWYYDTSNLRCISFTYYGCDGNPNNFPSKSLCETYCGVGGCPNGGQSYREPNSGFLRVCSGAVTCPSGYECDSVNEGGAAVQRCCPTKAQICSTPPTQGTSCGSINTERYYFNRVTRECTTFNYQGCESTGNNFGALAQCRNYCSSAACGAGEVVFLDPNTQRPRTCNQQLTNACPTGYTCRYDSLTQNSVCCGATNSGVCTETEKAYIEALTMDPRECMPNIASTCPNQYQCRYNNRRGKYYCCAALDGQICPAGRAPFYDTNTRSPITCTISSIVNSCQTGYTCQTVVPQSFSGYCCTASSVCPNSAPFDKNSFDNPVQCQIGGIAVCRSGFSCQTTLSGTSAGYCCEGTGNAENAGCPPNQYVAKDPQGNIPTCNPFGARTGCSSGNTCQWSNTRNSYQCCGTTPTAFVGAGSLGCPSSQVAFVDSATSQPRICPSLFSDTCPTGYFCQYSTERSVIQCCGVQDGCPLGSVAYIGSTGSAEQCNAAFGGCPSGFTCIQGSNGRQICCTAGGATTPTQPTTNCNSNQVLFNGRCLNRVAVGQRCTVSQQCLGNSACSNFQCTCAPGQQNINGQCSIATQAPQSCQPGQININGQCLNAAQPDQPCVATQQCQGGSICNGGVCRCNAGTTNINGICQAQQVPQLQGGECPAGSRVYTDNGVPRTCSGNSYACPAGNQCSWSQARRQYYCCLRARATQPEPVGENGCRSGKALMYPGTGTPLICQQTEQCPAGYECQKTTDGKQNQCCGGQRRSASNSTTFTERTTEAPVVCKSHEVQVIRHTNGQTRIICQLNCPYNEIPVNGVCQRLNTLRDDPDVDLAAELKEIEAEFS